MPYEYPESSTERKHAPSGYSDYTKFRPWLRDEFQFRCVYCLFRETWGRPGHTAAFHVEHVMPKSKHKELSTKYENLAYSCDWCNFLKGEAVFVPSPSDFSNSDHFQVNEDGTLTYSDTPTVRQFVKKLRLDSSFKTSERIEYLEEHVTLKRRRKKSKHDNAKYLRKFGYPEDLPDLANVEPKPQKNDKPNGIKDCHYEQRVTGTLPETYC